jgi:AraC family transcriptional regulator, regulatory protein of adaptative response / DNA-3-methyladenine glycosylase II
MSVTFDRATCYQAIQARDTRFDGRLFVGVKTTGIYCRPICPARTPQEQNCVFFTSAAAAHQAGFRSCLRCRPELSPQLWSHVGTGVTVNRALDLIAAGALDRDSVSTLAGRLGIGDRHLRQLFHQHLGTSPTAVAQTSRILLAKQLITETNLSMTEVAMAAGFGSIRRFNTVVQQCYDRSPSELRRNKIMETTQSTPNIPSITLKLPYSPPYPWEHTLSWLATRAISGMESIEHNCYQRLITLAGHQGTVSIRADPDLPQLLATISFPELELLSHIVARLNRMFDLHANVRAIAEHLRTDPILIPAIEYRPGARIPGCWDTFELAVRAILGQQVSVAAATTLARRLVATYGEPALHPTPTLNRTFPTSNILATADLTQIGVTKPRAKAISSLAAAIELDPTLLQLHQGLEDTVERLCRLPGIGSWTAQYIAMRAFGEPDAFPATDLALVRAMNKLGETTTKTTLNDRSQQWRPWRAYAAMYLWAWDGRIVNSEQ